MKILVINAGSSSLKFQLIDMNGEKLLVKGLCDRIGIDNSILEYSRTGSEKVVFNKEMKNHKDAITMVIKVLTDEKIGVIKDMSEISGVGHRVLHGAEKFHNPEIINEKVMEAIVECIPLGPLHNPANLMGIEGCKQVMPETPMVAVFDTGFHQTMPKHAFMYPLPYEYYKKYSIRKYGFHGTSHKYIGQRTAEFLDKSPKGLKIISCHLGNGASICAIKDGECIDTSMGLTPLDGLEMGTRCGTIDPATVTFIMKKENLTPDQMDTLMNKKSGVLGVSGVSSDFRDLSAAAKEGNERAKLAIDIFCYRVKTYIGSYAAAMNGVDAIVFTGGIGENDLAVRKQCVSGLDFLGITIDDEKNAVRGKEIAISTPESKVKVLVIPTNEELAIARETLKLISNK